MKAFIILALVALVALSYGAPAGPGERAEQAAADGGDPEDAAKDAAGGSAEPTTKKPPHHHHHHHHHHNKPKDDKPKTPKGDKPPTGPPPPKGDKPPTAPKPPKGDKPPTGPPPPKGDKPQKGDKPPPGGKPPQVGGANNKSPSNKYQTGELDTVLKKNPDPNNHEGTLNQVGEALGVNSPYRGRGDCENKRGAVYEKGAHHTQLLGDIGNVVAETGCEGTEATEAAKAILGKSRSNQGATGPIEGVGLLVQQVLGGPKKNIAPPVEPERPLLVESDHLPLKN